MTDTSGKNLGLHNPLRYRGYVYDRETGLYYLQSRYYNPTIGRFINVDGQFTTGDLTGLNMFAYCGNNPVNRTDPTGDAWWHWAVAAAVVAAAAVAVVVTAGGAAAAIAAVSMVASGVAASSTAATVAAGVFIGSATAFAGAAYMAALESNSADEFADYGEGALIATGLGGALSGLSAYGLAQTPKPSPQPASTSACFIAGTLVHTKAGMTPIEKIRTGDMVWAWDEETGEITLKPVVETYVNETNDLVHVFVNGEEIITTPKHPFYSPVKGWTEAAQLRAGDILVLVNGEYVVVEKVQHELLEDPVTVYNFQVQDYHTYYVSQMCILVHNTCSASSSQSLPQNGITLGSSEALDLANDFLGSRYTEVSPGRFVSADGLRQVRMTASDLSTINNHAGAPHLNFETLAPNPYRPGKFMITGNSHVYIFD
jgi:RHS repeat-associated protein